LEEKDTIFQMFFKLWGQEAIFQHMHRHKVDGAVVLEVEFRSASPGIIGNGSIKDLCDRLKKAIHWLYWNKHPRMRSIFPTSAQFAEQYLDFDDPNNIIPVDVSTENDIDSIRCSLLNHQFDLSRPLWKFLLHKSKDGSGFTLFAATKHIISDAESLYTVLSEALETLQSTESFETSIDKNVAVRLLLDGMASMADRRIVYEYMPSVSLFTFVTTVFTHLYTVVVDAINGYCWKGPHTPDQQQLSVMESSAGPTEVPWSVVLSKPLPADTLRALLQLARSRRVTLTTLLNAIVAESVWSCFPSAQKKLIGVSTAINLRRFLSTAPPQYTSVGCFAISSMFTLLRYEPKRSIWETAAKVHELVEPKGLTQSLAMVALSRYVDVVKLLPPVRDGLAGRFAPCSVITTNMGDVTGKLPKEVSVGGQKFYPVRSIFCYGNFGPTLSVTTFQGSLYLALTARKYFMTEDESVTLLDSVHKALCALVLS
jgi:hypothetical protein